MKSACIIALAVVSLATPAATRTMEEVAVVVGKLSGGYKRAAFLCKAGGIPMPDIETLNPRQVQIMLDMHERYPEYFKLGWEQGWKGANVILEDKRDLPSGCAGFLERATPKK